MKQKIVEWMRKRGHQKYIPYGYFVFFCLFILILLLVLRQYFPKPVLSPLQEASPVQIILITQKPTPIIPSK